MEVKNFFYLSTPTIIRKFGGPRTQRPLESVLLEDGIKEKVIEDIEEFLKNAKWYRDMGIPYRRGYLFHGYPGSGKVCTRFINFKLTPYRQVLYWPWLANFI